MTKQEFLSASLPYGLKCEDIFDCVWTIHPYKDALDTLNDNEHLSFESFIKENEAAPNTHKLIVRPLSDLTKECVQKDYNNGEPFVPIEILGKAYEKNGTFEDGLFGWNCATGGDDYQDYYFTIDKTLTKYQIYCGEPDEGGWRVDEQNLSFLAIQQLLKWHFWPNMPEGEEVVWVTDEFNPYK